MGDHYTVRKLLDVSPGVETIRTWPTLWEATGHAIDCVVQCTDPEVHGFEVIRGGGLQVAYYTTTREQV